MSRKKKAEVPILKVRKGATLKEIYAAAKKAFTIDDLLRYVTDEPMVPVEQVLDEVEKRHKVLVETHGPDGTKNRRKK